MAAEDGEAGFGEGKLCLPSHDHDVPDKAGDRKELTRQRLLIQYYHHQPHGQHHRRRSSPPEPFPQILCHDHHEQHLKSSGRPHDHRPKLGTNGASGGPGMQAFFLESAGRRSCGTGVFLPQKTGTNPQSSKKPACSPVLLPNRVVQALNLNVHALGLHMSAPRKDNKCNHKAGRDFISNKKKNGKDQLPAQCYVISQNRSSSPEIFLPKEWTY